MKTQNNSKTLITSVAFLLTFWARTYAQQPPIMVCSPDGNTCAPFITLNEAYVAANSGDYIYLPGGGYALDSIIKKEIHLIGAGFNTTSSAVTGITTIFNNITITGGLGDHSSFEGFYLNGDIIVNEGSLKFIDIQRINFGTYSGVVENSNFIQSIIRGYINGGSNNTYISSFIYAIQGVSYSLFVNCIINCHQYSVYYGCSSIRWVNNITVKNCFIVGNVGDNILNSIFLNNSSDFSSFPSNVAHYDPTLDYHVIAGSSADNAGTDGTDIGIYGGSTPWKEGSVPSNPHIFFKEVDNTTNSNGNLPVHIKVSAED
jgi:hypothetical protein